MTNFEKAIDEFRERQANVYRVDQTRIVRDARSARRSAKDHAGRWFFELVQNCEDAKANEVDVRITDKAVYVGNYGDSFSPQAIEAISGTDFTDKPVGTIGRKGVGFKAVYQITSTPQVFVSNHQGLEFNPTKAEEWFSQQQINCTEGELPYQWLPFFISRSDAEAEDSVLRELSCFVTVVRLPFQSSNCRDLALKHLKDWPPYALLPFKHIEMLRVKSDDLSFSIDVGRKGDVWTLHDSRGDTQTRWRVRARPEKPDDKILSELDIDDRQRVQDVVFLVAAPVDSEGKVTTVKNSIPIHVFYPTEELSPVSVLMHAEFLVKSDRTAVIPLKDSRFNSWTADRLADLLVEFVNSCHDKTDPAAHLKLLAPIDSLESLPTTNNLWDRILRSAKDELRLPDSNGSLNLTVDEARILAVSVETNQARRILEGTPVGPKLVHESVDSNTQAKEALRKLGCRSISDNELLAIIEEQSKKKVQDSNWLWGCWYWLACWLANERRSDEHKQRRERLEKLPLIPINKTVVSREAMHDSIVTWRDDASEENIPTWAPLSFVADWFRDRILPLDKKDPISKLRSELDVTEPGEDVLVRAVRKAIDLHWDKPADDSSRFIRFLLSHDWDESADLTSLYRCPVLARISGKEESKWVPANEAYFGEEWGEKEIEALYDGVKGIAFAKPFENEKERTKNILQSIGVTPFPRIIKDTSKEACEKERDRVIAALPYHTARGDISAPTLLDRLNVRELDSPRVAVLLALLALHWDDYYRRHAKIVVEYRYYGWYTCSLNAHWWNLVLNTLMPPLEKNFAVATCLSKSWLPDKSTKRAIGDLMPVIDLSVFGNHTNAVKKWLTEAMKVRCTLKQIDVDEWSNLISERIPHIIPAHDLTHKPEKRDIVTRWYEACLHSLDEQDDIPTQALSDAPLLCRKGDDWSYTHTKSIWLSDDDELANAFRQDCRQIELPAALHSQAKKHFGLRPLSEGINVKYQQGQLSDEQSKELQHSLEIIIPYVFAWRCSQAKKTDSDTIRNQLQSLTISVVSELRGTLTLDGVGQKEVEKWFGVEDSHFLVNAKHWQKRLTLLGRALADALHVRTDADFYENLLHFSTETERKGKLLSKGVTEGELERLLRLFRQEPDKTEPSETPFGAETSETPGTPKTKEQSTTSTAPTDTSSTGSANGPSAGPKEEPESPEKKPIELELKDPESAEIVLSSVISTRSRSGHTPSSSGEGGKDSDRDELTQEQKDEIEDCGRGATARELRKMGYDVTPMPRHNPGFDIKATKHDEELRVEIKAHRRTSKTAQVTVRQFGEYEEQLRNQSVEWQLWNVENLSAHVSAPIRITRYDTIPREALSTQQFSLDLSKCTPIPTKEAE